MFGPPEKCYYTEVTDEAGMIYYVYGKGKTLLIPWGIGSHYEKLSNHGHSALILSSLHDLLQVEQKLHVTASPVIEIAFHRNIGTGKDMIHAVNLSGQLGTAYHKPLPVHNIEFIMKIDRPIKKMTTLWGKEKLKMSYDQTDSVTFTIPTLELLETVVIEYQTS